MINILKESFEADGSKTAYRTTQGEITFAELWELAKRYAYTLKASRNPVIVKGGKETHMIAAFIACIMASRPYVPCDSETPEARIRKITELSGADTVVDASTVPPAEKLEEFRNNDDDIAYIIFTSGSTGDPKGVPISRANLKAFIGGLLLRTDALTACKGRTVLNQAKFSFDLSVADIYFSLCTGSTLFALTSQEQKDPLLMIKAVAESNASLAVMTPTFAKYCLCMPEFGRDTLPELHTIFFCGETLEPKTVRLLSERFQGIRIINAYGPTEATCAVCCAEITPELCGQSILPCGTEGNGTCGITVDGGEILLDGKSVFGGYLNGEKRIGAYRTGDCGRIENGYIYCSGRKHGYIKFKGHRIEPDEIKTAIVAIDGVDQCSVRVIENSSGTVTGIVAAVVAKDLDADAIKSQLRETLPEYMIPRIIEISREISFNANGKQNI